MPPLALSRSRRAGRAAWHDRPLIRRGPLSDSPAPNRSLTRIAFAGAAWLSVLNGIAGLALLGLNVWLNRSLPDAPIAMGTWNLVLRLLLMTSLIFDGGIPAAIMQKEEISRGALAALSWLQVSLGLVGAALIYSLAIPLASLWADYPQAELSSCFRWAAPAVALIALGLPPKAVLQRDLRFRVVATIESCSTLALIAAGIALAPTLGPRALVVGMLLRHGSETILYWAFSSLGFRIFVQRFDFPSVAERLRFGASMAGQSLLGTLMRQGDGLLVGYLAGPIAGGLYGQLQALVVQPFAKLTLYVARAAFPTFAKTKDDPERLLRGLGKMQRLLALCVFPALVGMAAVAPRLLAVLLGRQYADHMGLAVPAFQVLCLGALLFTYGYSTAVALNAIGLSRPLLIRQAIGLLAVLLFMAAGSPWGLFGVSIGRALASALIAILYLDMARAILGFSWRMAGDGIREALPASLACFAVAWGAGLVVDRFLPSLAPHLPLVLGAQSLLGALVYAATLMLRGVRPRAEWAALRGR